MAFCSNQSVDTNIIDTYEQVSKFMNEGSPADMLLFNLAKAFNKVCHRRLNSKLCAVGIHYDVVNWIMQFPTNRKQMVRYLVTIDQSSSHNQQM